MEQVENTSKQPQIITVIEPVNVTPDQVRRASMTILTISTPEEKKFIEKLLEKYLAPKPQDIVSA